MPKGMGVQVPPRATARSADGEKKRPTLNVQRSIEKESAASSSYDGGKEPFGFCRSTLSVERFASYFCTGYL